MLALAVARQFSLKTADDDWAEEIRNSAVTFLDRLRQSNRQGRGIKHNDSIPLEGLSGQPDQGDARHPRRPPLLTTISGSTIAGTARAAW